MESTSPVDLRSLDHIRGDTLQTGKIDDHVISYALPDQYHTDHDQGQLCISQPVLLQVSGADIVQHGVNGAEVVVVHDLPDKTGYDTGDQYRKIQSASKNIFPPTHIIYCKRQ